MSAKDQLSEKILSNKFALLIHRDLVQQGVVLVFTCRRLLQNDPSFNSYVTLTLLFNLGISLFTGVSKTPVLLRYQCFGQKKNCYLDRFMTCVMSCGRTKENYITGPFPLMQIHAFVVETCVATFYFFHSLSCPFLHRG